MITRNTQNQPFSNQLSNESGLVTGSDPFQPYLDLVGFFGRLVSALYFAQQPKMKRIGVSFYLIDLTGKFADGTVAQSLNVGKGRSIYY